jgi:hypothetical protein
LSKTRLHVVTSKKIDVFIVTDVITSNLTFYTPKTETAFSSGTTARLHGDTSQKTVIFMVTAVRT